MTPEQILSLPAKVLTEEQRRFFFEVGYVCLPAFVPTDLLVRLQVASNSLIERSRSIHESHDEWVVAKDHSAEAPKLRRVYRVTDFDDAFWDFAAQSALPDVVADLVGPNVQFREAYINYKWAEGGDPVEWHQDLPFLPHTNKAVVTTLTYLADVTVDMGPFMVVPKSHKGELFDHYDADGTWVGRISDKDLSRVATDTAAEFVGPAGTVIFMDSSAVHGSRRNISTRSRPVLVTGYAAADAIGYGRNQASQIASQATSVVRGEPALYAHHEPYRMRLPPDWSGGYSSIFEVQQKEERPFKGAA